MADRDLLLLGGLAAGALLLSRLAPSGGAAGAGASTGPAANPPVAPVLQPLPTINPNDPNAYNVYTAPGVPSLDLPQALAWLQAHFLLPSLNATVQPAPSWLSPYGALVTFPGFPNYRVVLTP